MNNHTGLTLTQPTERTFSHMKKGLGQGCISYARSYKYDLSQTYICETAWEYISFLLVLIKSMVRSLGYLGKG